VSGVRGTREEGQKQTAHMGREAYKKRHTTKAQSIRHIALTPGAHVTCERLESMPKNVHADVEFRTNAKTSCNSHTVAFLFGRCATIKQAHQSGDVACFRCSIHRASRRGGAIVLLS
jgi:hypothetical protein